MNYKKDIVVLHSYQIFELYDIHHVFNVIQMYF